MFLKAAGNGLLAFAPGVGKTHTALAAAFEKLAEMTRTARRLAC
jgi:superfamily II DNA or RNA helicase